MLIDCITGIPRAQWEDSGCATFVQLVEFTHFPVISSEHGAAQVTEPSSGEMFRVHEQPEVIASDWDKLPSPIFVIEYGSGFAGRDFTWRPMQTTIHGSRSIPYRYFSLEFQERRIPMGHDGWTVMIRVVQRQHGGSFLRLAWDPGILVLVSSTTDTET
jgi:hypothetical protein